MSHILRGVQADFNIFSTTIGESKDLSDTPLLLKFIKGIDVELFKA